MSWKGTFLFCYHSFSSSNCFITYVTQMIASCIQIKTKNFALKDFGALREFRRKMIDLRTEFYIIFLGPVSPLKISCHLSKVSYNFVRRLCMFLKFLLF